ncbi:MAG TPA: histidine kinase [Actinocrinis sp.]|uniref:sensor histidine kinase n=1 Tax=Actinocrinis sp. TaxID=1920516 RepID=UPI002DDD1F4D|nr:histidine kinase [Actinocrinis sp.]HEV2343600.1 histidine kinase [Actinocrinis sp.]
MSDVTAWPDQWTERWINDRLVPLKRRRMFAARTMLLSFLIASIASGPLRFSGHGRGLASLILTVLCATGWLVWAIGVYMAPERIGEPAVIVALVLYGTAGSVLTGLKLPTEAVIFPSVAIVSAGIRFTWRQSLAAPIVSSAIMLLTAWLSHANMGAGIGYAGLLFGTYGLGLGRRAQILRAETAERLLTETRRANNEQAHAAALAERSRIAREIHDVLAHSLSALTVQLEAADALLTNGTDLVKAHGYVVKARHIAREGLTETRRAIAALREDTPPLRSMLHGLAEAYEAYTGASATVIADCEPTDLQPDATLALYRTAQESLTNARKHAPGAPIEITLTCDESAAVLTVTNQAASAPTTALASSGGGYGLAGLKERAELAGGAFEAGPWHGGWRVQLRIPSRPRPSP